MVYIKVQIVQYSTGRFYSSCHGDLQDANDHHGCDGGNNTNFKRISSLSSLYSGSQRGGGGRRRRMSLCSCQRCFEMMGLIIVAVLYLPVQFFGHVSKKVRFHPYHHHEFVDHGIVGEYGVGNDVQSRNNINFILEDDFFLGAIGRGGWEDM